MTTILLVEDEAAYRDTLTFKLNRDGYDVVAVGNGQEAVDRFERARPDLVLLDLMLPGLSGTEVCRQIRQKSSVPVIMLTAKDSEIDKVVGLEIGADDYVTKPYSYRELVARIKAVLRRGAAEEEDSRESTLRVGRVAMNTDRHEVAIDGEKAAMPLREFELLELFMRNPDRVLTRAQIIDRIWGPDYIGDTKTLDVHVKRLRSKIEVEPSKPTMLQTVRGLGYKLVSD
ncbi:response regulator transcription factor [Flaviflexus salsibiostraticola]|uniref:Sensory transduction protein RegX3 n=1 Tax=Flaviflexus salsibiostraticola TaxID=1282737 RepID=A0A3Q8WU97_9ACTO|nr:response regulator transcription factor [Flaviflexus salsibiostraticola]AZN30479.1 response regulator transcription factor [Flaviflexus salsibiostraticola]